MELNLKNKKALITGGSHGIGLAIKTALEEEGVKVISWSRSEDVDLMKEIPKLPEIDILINNFGGAGNSTNFLIPMDRNYTITARLTLEFLSNIKNWGRVITISSIYGKESGHNPYFDAAKSAQIAFMKTLSRKYSNLPDLDITFNSVCPGHIDVGKPFKDDPKIIGKPEDVANLVTFLCSNKAKHINGACITVDGGESHSF